jgi:rhamnogalacturonan endolyase
MVREESSKEGSLFARTQGKIAAGWIVAFAMCATMAAANVPGGVTGSGPSVAVKDNGDGTVTMSNGLVSIVIVTKSARLNEVKFTHHNGGSAQTSDVLKGKGQYYYGGFNLGTTEYQYSLAVDPARNGGQYADVMLLSDSENKGVMEVHFSMLRASPGFYSTAIMTHRKQDAAGNIIAWGVVTRVPEDFNWISADPLRSFLIGVPTKSGVKVPNAPHEITVNLSGSQAGEYADKFIYGQDHADLRAWGWSSVGQGGLNVGAWMMTTMEFSDGGPLKRDVSVYPYSELNNSILTNEVGMGSDGHLADGEEWKKTCGPWFIYYNQCPQSITDPKRASEALYDDALKQAEAEKQAWPYTWFKNPRYAQESERGTVTGKLAINDPGNPNASPAALWVGLEEQPQTSNGTHDFQKWLKAYQFWTHTDATGAFTIPHVLPGDHYTLWAYGPGAAGTFLSQAQEGGNPPLECDVAAKPFSVKALAGQTTDLQTVTWVPKRVGATVLELGYPDRKADKYRHSDDYWAPATAPKLGFPTPVWGGQMEFPLDFSNGMNFIVGKSRWALDWNYCLPAFPSTEGAYQPSVGKITFNLARAPASGSKASIYLACAGDDGGHVVLDVNDANLGSTQGVTSAPEPIDADGFNPPYFDDSSIHFCDHGPFSDERVNFPGSLLHAGQNTITIQMNGKSLTNYLMVDYLRLELDGYVPPAPASATVYAGHSRALVTWPLVPGATSYNVLRSTSPTQGFAPVATGLTAQSPGGDYSKGRFVDTKAADETQYYYVVQSLNASGHSTQSAPSAGVKPSSAINAAAPPAPVGLHVTGSGHQKVSLSWAPSPAASYFIVFRSALHADGVGGSYPLRWTVLDDSVTTPAFTDIWPSDGRDYRYCIEAVGPGGTSPASTTVDAKPVPHPPEAAPQQLTARWGKTRDGNAITLKWSPVPGATGYVVYRSTSGSPSFQWPSNFLSAFVEATYADKGPQEKNKPRGLPDGDYWYQVTAVNAGGVSPPSTVHVTRTASREDAAR